MSAGLEQSDELLVGFIDESLDGLRELPVQIGEHRQNPRDPDAINCVFRAIHSIKGNAGFFGLTAIKKFSHSLENTLDDIRNDKLSMCENLQRMFIEGFDLLDEMLQRVLEGDVDEEIGKQELELLSRVTKVAEENGTQLSEGEQLLADAIALAEEIAASKCEQAADWARRVRSLTPGAEDSEEGQDDDEAVKLDPTTLIGKTITIAGQEMTEKIAPLLDLFYSTENGQYNKEVGEAFLKAAKQLTSWAETAGEASLAESLTCATTDFKTIFDSPLDIDATLISIVWDHLEAEFIKLAPDAVGQPADSQSQNDQQTTADDSSTVTNEPVTNEPVTNEPVTNEPDDDESTSNESNDAKQQTQAKKAKGTAVKTRLLRVKEDRVDAFMDDVSSLFITAERLKDVHQRMAVEKTMFGLVEELRQINATFVAQTNDLQQSVVSLRKVPARGLFSKFPRVARSLASKLGKKLNVHLSGEELEIDKSLVEDLDAPLTHMVRNVCDHAIETPEERVERGVAEDGNMWLRCELTRTHVIITIQDDGRGIDPTKLRKKIVEKGILTQAQSDELTEQEAVELIFHPGFSTAEKVSDVSGRGVGMDVVRTKLREYDGDVRVESKVGVGSTFYLEIPLRQAVLVVDGLLMSYDGMDFVVPFEHILEIVELNRDELKTVQGKQVARIRGEPYAAVSLGQLLDCDKDSLGNGKTTEGVLIGCKEGSLCLLVDKIHGQRKVVVNNLGEILPGINSIAGVAQLGAGKLALVLSSPDLIQAARPDQAELVEA